MVGWGWILHLSQLGRVKFSGLAFKFIFPFKLSLCSWSYMKSCSTEHDKLRTHVLRENVKDHYLKALLTFICWCYFEFKPSAIKSNISEMHFRGEKKSEAKFYSSCKLTVHWETWWNFTTWEVLTTEHIPKEGFTGTQFHKYTPDWYLSRQPMSLQHIL